jgi:hypothetical protein
MRDPAAYKLDKLIVTAKQLGSSRLFLVKIIGMGDQFQTSVEANSPIEAAKDVVEELTFAAHHPHKFFNRRKLAAQQSGAMGHDFDKMIEVANEAVGYAALMKENLIRAVFALDDGTFRKLGG